MSELRRRSRDARAPVELEQLVSKSPPARVARSRALIRLAVLLSIILTTVVLVLSFRGKLETPTLPFALPLGAGVSHIEDRIPYRLRPQDHAYRTPGVVSKKWNITSGMRRPDGVLKRLYLINAEFPGPTIECRSGDRIIIEVKNALEEEGVSIHWHGLSMRGANNMDGAAGITNKPIPPGASFTYDFKIEDTQHGTFWYHAHEGVQRADGLSGGFVVHSPVARKNERHVDTEHLLAIGDWYHRSGKDALEFYMHPGSFGNEPVPDSLLVNGIGNFNCSNAVPARPLDCDQQSAQPLPALAMDKAKRNILRVINVGSYSGISLSLPGFRLKPLAVDGGNPVYGVAAQQLENLQPGERVDVLVEPATEIKTRHDLLEVSIDTTTFKYPNPALTPHHSFHVESLGSPAKANKFGEAAIDKLDLADLKADPSQNGTLPEKADRTIVLYSATQKLAHLDNVPRGFINHTSWTSQSSPLLALSRNAWDKNQFVPAIGYDLQAPIWVDIVLNNLDEESHPFHLHGYDFWVLSTYSSTFNWGSYNPFEDDEAPGGAYDLINPVKKDTVLVPRRGYAVLRFRANNPGIWMFHCHVLWHQASGMAMAFEVGNG